MSRNKVYLLFHKGNLLGVFGNLKKVERFLESHDIAFYSYPSFYSKMNRQDVVERFEVVLRKEKVI